VALANWGGNSAMLCEGKENMNIVEGEEIGRGEENF